MITLRLGSILFLILHLTWAKKKCPLNQTIIKEEKEHAFVSFYPKDQANETFVEVEPRTVVSFTCKSNTRRYKHHCNSKGNWDLIPGTKSCKENCIEPHWIWPILNWNCTNDMSKYCQGLCASSNESLNIHCLPNGKWDPDPDKKLVCPSPFSTWPWITWVATPDQSKNAAYFGNCNGNKLGNKITIKCRNGCWEEDKPCDCPNPEELWPDFNWTSGGGGQRNRTYNGICPDSGEGVKIYCQMGVWTFDKYCNGLCSPSDPWERWSWITNKKCAMDGTFRCNGTCPTTNRNVSLNCLNGEWHWDHWYQNCPAPTTTTTPTSSTTTTSSSSTSSPTISCPNFDDEHGSLKCSNALVGDVCVLDCDYGYVANPNDVMICTQYGWARQKDEQIIQHMSCERPVAIIVGGTEFPNSTTPTKTVEVYHPSKTFVGKIPDLPKELIFPMGQFLDGNLYICGSLFQDQVDIEPEVCYVLEKPEVNQLAGSASDDRKIKQWAWNSTDDPKPYYHTTSGQISVLESGWHIYSINGEIITDFNRITSKVNKFGDIFEDSLESHCSFMTKDHVINILGENHWYQCDTLIENDGMNCTKHELNHKLRQPHCEKINKITKSRYTNYEDQILVWENRNILLCHELDCSELWSSQSTKDVTSQLTTLEGKPTILGGSITNVEQLNIVDGSSIEFITAKNSLKIPRQKFAVILVPESFFPMI